MGHTKEGGHNPSTGRETRGGQNSSLSPILKLPPKSEEKARIEVRLLKKRQVSSEGCWLWTGELNHGGYGFMRAVYQGKKHRRVHRLAFTLWKGPIPDSYAVHHTCAKPSCYNPDHLQLVTDAENNVEMLQRKAYKATIVDLRSQVTKLERKVKKLERKLSETL